MIYYGKGVIQSIRIHNHNVSANREKVMELFIELFKISSTENDNYDRLLKILDKGNSEFESELKKLLSEMYELLCKSELTPLGIKKVSEILEEAVLEKNKSNSKHLIEQIKKCMQRYKFSEESKTDNDNSDISKIVYLIGDLIDLSSIISTGNITAQYVLAISQVKNINPYYIIGAVSEKGECTKKLLKNFMEGLGYENFGQQYAQAPTIINGIKAKKEEMSAFALFRMIYKSELDLKAKFKRNIKKIRYGNHCKKVCLYIQC